MTDEVLATSKQLAERLCGDERCPIRIYGTTMYRRSCIPGSTSPIYSDQEDTCPRCLLRRIADMKAQGWSEVPNNYYVRAGLHPNRKENEVAAT